MGSNMAESHPVGFHWPVQAQQRGSVLIHVDPRYTRTSAVADVFVKIRAGTDIAFLGGIIRYILEHERYFKEYIVHTPMRRHSLPTSTGTRRTMACSQVSTPRPAAMTSFRVPGNTSASPGRMERGACRESTQRYRIPCASCKSSSAITRATPPRLCPGSAAAVPRMWSRWRNYSAGTPAASGRVRSPMRWGGPSIRRGRR